MYYTDTTGSKVMLLYYLTLIITVQYHSKCTFYHAETFETPTSAYSKDEIVTKIESRKQLDGLLNATVKSEDKVRFSRQRQTATISPTCIDNMESIPSN